MAVFMLSAVALTSIASSSLLARDRAAERIAIDNQLGQLLTEAATVPMGQLVAGTFDVPRLCSDSPLSAGPAGESCLTVSGVELRVQWAVTATAPDACYLESETDDPGNCITPTLENPCAVGPVLSPASTAPERAGWVCMTARVFAAEAWAQRSLVVAVPPRSDVAPLPPPAGVRLVMSPAQAIQGTDATVVVSAIAPSGQPQAGIDVLVRPVGLPEVAGTTDDRGRATVTVPIPSDTYPGLVAVGLVGGGVLASGAIRVLPAPATVLVASSSLALAPGGGTTVRIQVVDAEGVGVANVPVAAAADSPLLVTQRLSTLADTTGESPNLAGSAVFYVAAPTGTAPGTYTIVFVVDLPGTALVQASAVVDVS